MISSRQIVVGEMKTKKVRHSMLPKAKAIGRQNPMYNTLTEIAGEDVIPVVKYLKDKKNISEFKIADATNTEVNRIRSMLYKLHESNLVTYYRKKDRKKGWYISYWTFNMKGLPHLQHSMRRQKIEQLKDRLVREESNLGTFYICRNVCTRLDFESAFENEFRCPECGELIHQQDNTKTIENIRVRLKELEAK